MTTSNESTGPIIPDFEKDAQSIAAYDEARVRFERREAGDAESRTRNSFTKKRDAIRAEIAVAGGRVETRERVPLLGHVLAGGEHRRLEGRG